MNLVKENIHNLTALWRLVGTRARAFHSGEQFSRVAIDYSDWPNRLWPHQELNETALTAIKAELLQSSTELILPHWDIYPGGSDDLLETVGFEVRSTQLGMALHLAGTFPEDKSLDLQKVQDVSSAGIWASLFEQSFGYHINPVLLSSTRDEIDYLIASFRGVPVGTGLLYAHTDNIVGIHSMGIIPEYRRRGFAEKMMWQLLNRSIELGFEYVTLQASEMGKGLYLKLGFEEQFLLKNYALKRSA